MNTCPRARDPARSPWQHARFARQSERRTVRRNEVEMEAEAMFVRDGDAFVGTTLTQGGWDRRHMNGSAVLALLGHCLDDVPTLAPMVLARFTADLARPLPIGPRLHVVPEVVREGKKLQLVQLRIVVDDLEHAWASALRLRVDDLSSTPGLPES